jgi:hypothetical protein
MIIYRKTILPLNIENSNGRFYDMESAEKILLEYKRQVERLDNFFGVCHFSNDYLEYGDPDVINIKNIGFVVQDLRIIKDKAIVGDIHILETPAGKQLKDSIRTVVFRTSVWGFVENGRVKVERLISINSISKYLDSFRI